MSRKIWISTSLLCILIGCDSTLDEKADGRATLEHWNKVNSIIENYCAEDFEIFRTNYIFGSKRSDRAKLISKTTTSLRNLTVVGVDKRLINYSQRWATLFELLTSTVSFTSVAGSSGGAIHCANDAHTASLVRHDVASGYCDGKVQTDD